jgi:hypothetical protein
LCGYNNHKNNHFIILLFFLNSFLYQPGECRAALAFDIFLPAGPPSLIKSRKNEWKLTVLAGERQKKGGF